MTNSYQDELVCLTASFLRMTPPLGDSPILPKKITAGPSSPFAAHALAQCDPRGGQAQAATSVTIPEN